MEQLSYSQLFPIILLHMYIHVTHPSLELRLFNKTCTVRNWLKFTTITWQQVPSDLL